MKKFASLCHLPQSKENGEEEFDDGGGVFPSLRKKTNPLSAGGKARNHSGYDEFLSEPPNEDTSN